MANKNLTAAKTAKNDEFYTRLCDIENEMKHYREHFRRLIFLASVKDMLKSFYPIVMSEKMTTFAPDLETQ